MKNLIEILKKETESLKIQYIEMNEKWAEMSFNSMLNADYLYKHTSGKYFKNRFGSTKAEDAMINRNINIVNSGLLIYMSKIVKDAEFHYESSILKLADRISKKGLNFENLKVKTSHVSVNIETTLTDGCKTVRAFTIIASGEIQRPHYRYLIK